MATTTDIDPQGTLLTAARSARRGTPPSGHDPFLIRALRKVARGEIVASHQSGALRHRTEDLSSRMFSTLFILRRDGHVSLNTTESDHVDGWISAELTSTGTTLLAYLTRSLEPRGHQTIPTPSSSRREGR